MPTHQLSQRHLSQTTLWSSIFLDATLCTWICLDFTMRAQLVYLLHTDHVFHDICIYTHIYAPVSSHRARNQLSKSLYQHNEIWWSTESTSISYSSWRGLTLSMYDLQRSGVQFNAPPTWQTWLELHLSECIHDNIHFPDHGIPTYRHSCCLSTIDYIYAPSHLSCSICHEHVLFVNNNWTDYAILRPNIFFSCTNESITCAPRTSIPKYENCYFQIWKTKATMSGIGLKILYFNTPHIIPNNMTRVTIHSLRFVLCDKSWYTSGKYIVTTTFCFVF